MIRSHNRGHCYLRKGSDCVAEAVSVLLGEAVGLPVTVGEAERVAVAVPV